VSGIRLGSWGSGTVEPDTRIAYSGKESLRIVSQGPYQGVRVELSQPADLSPYIDNKFAYLQFAVRIPSLGTGGTNSRFPGGFPGGFPGAGPGPGGPPPGIFMGYGGRGRGAARSQNVRSQKQQTVENLRVVLVT